MKMARKVLINVVVILLCAVFLFPIYLVIVNSFKNRSELYENIMALPKSFSFDYYRKAMEKMDFLRSFGNSLLVTLITIVIIVLLASMTAWMLVRMNNIFSKLSSICWWRRC